jgi:preprotein translocase subunit SecD
VAASKSRPGRVLIVLVVALVALFAWMAISGTFSPQLGLDLRGGTSAVLKPVPVNGDPNSITQDSLNQAVDIMRARVNGTGVAEADVTTQGTGTNAVIVVAVPGVNEQDLVDSLTKSARMTFRPVLAATSGSPAPTTSPTPSPSSTKKGKPGSSSSPTAKPKPSGSTSSQGSIVPRTSLRDASGSPSPSPSATTSAPTPTASATTGTSPSPSPSASATTDTPSAATVALYKTADCSTEAGRQAVAAKQTDNAPAVACSVDGTTKYLLGPVAVDGKDITGASAGIPQNGTAWVVNVNFNSAGSQAFGDTTKAIYQKQSPQNQFAIVLDGQVISAPVPNGPIYGGAEISGDFTQQDATTLANQLKYGSLPLQFDVAETQTISPTLGSDQLTAGLIAGALGLLVVVIYLLAYYRALGLVAVASLGIAAGFTYGLVVLLSATMGYTLTLAGVAGLVVAIGITADSFIVYFERIRDEMRDGRSLRVAVEAGWVRARRTIIAADSVSLIAAVVLYLISVGGVRGFAFSLGLTTLVDLGVVFLFTKPMMTLLAGRKFFNSGSRWSGLSRDHIGDAVPVAATRSTLRGGAKPAATAGGES